MRNGRAHENYYYNKKKSEIAEHTRFLSTPNVGVQVDNGKDDDAAVGNGFDDTDSDSAVAVACTPDDDDDTEMDGNGDGESNDNGDDDDDCN